MPTTPDEEPLPLRNPWVMAASWLPSGGLQDSVSLDDEEGYDLPVSTRARHDVRFAGEDAPVLGEEPAYVGRVGVLWASGETGVTALTRRHAWFDDTVGALTANAPVRVFIQTGTPDATAAALLARVERWIAANGLAK